MAKNIDSSVIRKDDLFIARATTELQKRIESELQIPDPEPERALAIMARSLIDETGQSPKEL